MYLGLALSKLLSNYVCTPTCQLEEQLFKLRFLCSIRKYFRLKTLSFYCISI